MKRAEIANKMKAGSDVTSLSGKKVTTLYLCLSAAQPKQKAM